MLIVSSLTPTFGAKIENIDCSKVLPDDEMRKIVATLNDAGVVIIRDQRLSIEQFMSFSRRIGPLAIHPLKQFSKPGFPELMVASNIIEEGKPIGLVDGGQHWHTDGAYLETPPRATVLYSLEIPVKNGTAIGDTMFADTVAAYEALDAATKSRLKPLKALNCHGVARQKRGESLHLDASQKDLMLKGIEKPVVKQHPYTRRDCLYVNRGSTLRIMDMDEGESDKLLETLFEHVVRPEFIYRHNWRVGDIVMWDDCSTQHCAVADYELPQRRLIYRTVVQAHQEDMADEIGFCAQTERTSVQPAA